MTRFYYRPNDDSHFALETQALQTYLPLYGTDNILAITVGSEALYRKDMTGQDLANRLETVRTLCKKLNADSIPIGFADSWNLMLEGEAVPVIQASDIVYAPLPPSQKKKKYSSSLGNMYPTLIVLFTDNALSYPVGLQMHSVTGRGKRLPTHQTCSLITL